MKVTKNLGDWHYGDNVDTGVIASQDGDYIFEYEILGMTGSRTITVSSGDTLKFTNQLNEIAVCRFRIKLPDTSGLSGSGVIPLPETDINYVTTAHGEMIFEYRNIL